MIETCAHLAPCACVVPVLPVVEFVRDECHCHPGLLISMRLGQRAVRDPIA